MLHEASKKPTKTRRAAPLYPKVRINPLSRFEQFKHSDQAEIHEGFINCNEI